MSNKIIVAVGGTGGHIFPAIAFAQELQEKDPEVEILFVGAHLSTNPFFHKGQYAFQDILASPSLLKGVKNNYLGMKKSFKILKEFAPKQVVGFGSYHSLPMLAAAILTACPTTLYAADLYPGRVIRLLAPFAEKTAIHFSAAKVYLPKASIEVMHPLQENFFKEYSREEALLYFGLEDRKTLLIFGGSQGALSMNRKILEFLPYFHHTFEDMQVLHFVGEGVEEWQKVYETHKICARVKAFESNMALAWKVATLALVRAGAGAIAEHLFSKVPALFVPYPLSKDDHQGKNARFASEEIKGSLMLEEKELNASSLARSLKQLLEESESRKQTLMDYYRDKKRLSEVVYG